MADPTPSNTPRPEARFFNVAAVKSSRREFFFEFGQIVQRPASQSPLIEALGIATLVTTPGHAKALMVALQDVIRRYEEKFEIIEAQESGEPH